MAEKQAEALDESDLNEQKCETDQQEVERHAYPPRCRGSFLGAPKPRERQQDEDGSRRDGLEQRQDDDKVTGIDKHEPDLPMQRRQLWQEAPPEESKEERPVVRRRPDVEPVVGDERRSRGAEQRDCGVK